MYGGGGPGFGDAESGRVSRDELEEAHAELLDDSSIQFDFPEPDRTEFNGEPLRLEPGTQVDDTALFGGASGAQWVFWVIIALAAAGLLFLVVSRLAGWQRRERRMGDQGAGPDWRMEEQAARTLLDDADALAAAGRYSEAAHLLLHRSIEEIDSRRPATVRKALTSRDIAGLPAIPLSPREAFARIVQAVERSLFGRRALDAADWRECREAYERFAFAREWQR